jgi:hypothetical protein
MTIVASCCFCEEAGRESAGGDKPPGQSLGLSDHCRICAETVQNRNGTHIVLKWFRYSLFALIVLAN